MTTIYEIFLEMVKLAEQKFDSVMAGCGVGLGSMQVWLQDTLRQSFIAMVEGEIEEVRERYNLITASVENLKKMGFAERAYLEETPEYLGRKQELGMIISRLESELLKLKEN